MRKNYIGVDIGGTKIAAGSVDTEGAITESIFVPTLAEEGFNTSISQIYSAIDDVLKVVDERGEKADGIGVCAPGPLDPMEGIVYNPPNLPGWDKVPLTDMISKRFGLPVILENDANAAGMAELIWGAAKGYKNVFYATVSTGIGTAVIIDGKIYHGKNGMAGEAGHVTIDYDSKVSCNCGGTGCVEALASGMASANTFKRKICSGVIDGSGVLKMAGGDVENITMKHIADAAAQGDEEALRSIREQGTLLGIWLAGMISVLDPEIVVIGGGVSLAGDLLFSSIRKSIPDNTINIFAADTPIVPAELRENVGILGAVSTFL